MKLHDDARRFASPPSEEDDLRKGPWTVEEDLLLMNYIAVHGEGRWNSVARCSGLKRTGKSCRLRWLNYLRPDVRHGNITPEEQLLILELHCRWGNRWSKIAQNLPGRTDNEIKNYWRTKVQKHAKQLQCDINSKQFKDIMRYLWMPRLMERIRAASVHQHERVAISGTHELVQEKSSAVGSSDAESFEMQEPSAAASDCFAVSTQGGDLDVTGDWFEESQFSTWWRETLPSPGSYDDVLGLDDFDRSGWGESVFGMDDDMWLQRQQF
ncbi:hypothetical protein OPV22_034627 [Ensete ventricosum]|uniref:Uncharacterized protein n=1 Tax=Ensete ventricosum TaxID=4639 RepID=A0AAV8PT59_ENSVE|nr:hypothetical protein OPV22_034627 [Ensete ventricosum]